MPPLTEAELALQRKYAELRKKKEQRKLQLQAQQGPQAAAASASTGPAGRPASAVEKAKAVLANKAAAGVSEEARISGAKPSTPPAAQTVDPVAAAKRALEAKKKAAESKQKQHRPQIKRPTSQRPASSEGQANGKSGGGRQDGGSEGNERNPKRARYDEARQEAQERNETTIFVGDLPPYYRREDVRNVFLDFGAIKEVKVMRDQCYAFVTFERKEVVQDLIMRYAHQPLLASGHELRINEAYGQMPSWKIAPIGGHDKSSGERVEVGAGPRLPHPKVEQARQHGNALAQQLAQAGLHGLDFNARPQQRQMVTYDDL